MVWVIDRICRTCEHRDEPCDYCLIQAGFIPPKEKEDKK